MAIVVRYFSTSGAGAADGTSWADRAALFSAGNWSTVVTGFNFGGSDALECRIGPGTYTCSQALGAAQFTTAAPTAANPLFLHGADSSGNRLAVPAPSWVSASPAWDDSALPVIATTTNIATLNSLTTIICRLIKFTASGRNGTMLSLPAALFWCVAVNSTANTSAVCSTNTRGYGNVFRCTGSSYDAVLSVSDHLLLNSRIEGVAGSSGNRRGILLNSSTAAFDLVTVVGVGGDAVVSTATQATQAIRLSRCTLVNCGGTGVKANSTASQTNYYEIHNCMITGMGAWGIDGNSAAGRVLIRETRLRDNASGNITGLGNYPTDFGIETTDSDDATEYVNAAGGDYRIKNTAAIWGQNYGVADEAGAGGGGLLVHPGYSGGLK